MRDDILAIPDHLRDALWRVESARLSPAESAGLLVCGMGGSAIGADLAASALGRRCAKPMLTVRGYELPSWATSEWTVLCSSYSGNTEETLACFEEAAELGAARVVASSGGALSERAREAGVPVIGLPGILQPRLAVAYMVVTAAEVAAAAGVGPRIAAEIEAASAFLEGEAAELQTRAAELAERLDGTLPVVHGADLTAPVARRWKTQINENAKLHCFHSELPEADHNEICGWGSESPSAAVARSTAVFLEDADQSPRMRRRFELTAEAIAATGAKTARIETAGESRSARQLWSVMLGDLVSLDLAQARGVDPVRVEALDALKQALESTS